MEVGGLAGNTFRTLFRGGVSGVLFSSSDLFCVSSSLSEDEEDESEDELDWLGLDLLLVAENFSFKLPCKETEDS